MSVENRDERFIDLRDIVGVRFTCARCPGQASLSKNHVVTSAVSRDFLSGHMHDEVASLVGSVNGDAGDLDAALTKFFSADLPRVLDIMERRKLTVELEITR